MNEGSSFNLGEPVERNPRLSDLVSERLLAAIREAELPPGARLPSERELGDQFGVSRTVIREAIRYLAAKGVVDVQSGSGARVADVDGKGVSESLALYLHRWGKLDPQKIDEVRETLELATVEFAAQRASDGDLADIRSTCEELAQATLPEEAARADLAFHRAIAAATGNELFLVLLDSISDVMLEIRLATLHDPERVEVVAEQHARIADALEDRDPTGAVAAMKDHLVDSVQAFARTQR
jgi:GntR family transcriptional regulator, transcriptional repressor for pyruvate dehydrogenase complex